MLKVPARIITIPTIWTQLNDSLNKTTPIITVTTGSKTETIEAFVELIYFKLMRRRKRGKTVAITLTPKIFAQIRGAVGTKKL